MSKLMHNVRAYTFWFLPFFLSLSQLVLKRYRVVTDGQTDKRTDRITIA